MKFTYFHIALQRNDTGSILRISRSYVGNQPFNIRRKQTASQHQLPDIHLSLQSLVITETESRITQEVEIFSSIFQFEIIQFELASQLHTSDVLLLQSRKTTLHSHIRIQFTPDRHTFL